VSDCLVGESTVKENEKKKKKKNVVSETRNIRQEKGEKAKGENFRRVDVYSGAIQIKRKETATRRIQKKGSNQKA